MKFIKTFDDLDEAMRFALHRHLRRLYDGDYEFPEVEESYKAHLAAGKDEDAFDDEEVEYQVFLRRFAQIKEMSSEDLQSKFTYYENGDGQCRGQLTMSTAYYHCMEGWMKEVDWFRKGEDSDDYLICVNNEDVE
jgi:hypothetical protein